jgi:hypothetical protein
MSVPEMNSGSSPALALVLALAPAPAPALQSLSERELNPVSPPQTGSKVQRQAAPQLGFDSTSALVANAKLSTAPHPATWLPS